MTTGCVRTSGQSCALHDEGLDRNRVVQANGAQRFLVAFFGRRGSIGLERRRLPRDRRRGREIVTRVSFGGIRLNRRL